MNLRILSLFFLLFCFSYGQKWTGAAFTGAAISDFENQQSTELSIPIGFKIGYEMKSNLDIGFGLAFTAKRFIFDQEDQPYILPNGDEVIANGEAEFSQTLFFLDIKYTFLKSSFKPYIFVQPGYFLGEGKLSGKYRNINDNFEDQGSLSFDFKGNFYFGFGAGLTLKTYQNSELRLNLSYNIITVEPDLPESQKEGGSNFFIILEYVFNFKKK